jgi:hypothetical protein
MSNIPEFKTGHTFLIVDNTHDYLAKDTPLESSVGRGLLRQVFPVADKCIAHIPLECLNETRALKDPLHNIMNYIPAKDEYKVQINYGSISIKGSRVFAQLYKKIFSFDEYQRELKDILQVTLYKI